MRIWRCTIMLAAVAIADYRLWLWLKSENEESKRDQRLLNATHSALREEHRILTESLDRCKLATAAVIEQREELARRIRESKR